MVHPKMLHTYVGLDSHKNSHTAVFLDCFFERLGEITFSSKPSEFPIFLRQAEKYRQAETTFAFGFEDTTLYGRSLVKYLIQKKQLVKHTNSALVASERSSRNILHKTDAIDAECAARVLLNRFGELPVARVDDPHWILASLIARRNSTVKINTMLRNQLHHLVHDQYPDYRQFFYDFDCNSSLSFYEKFPSPATLIDVTVEELTTFIKGTSKGRQGEKKAKHILNIVQQNDVPLFEYQEVRDFTIQSTVRQLKANLGEIKTIDNQLKGFLNEFGYSLTSMKGIDFLTASKLIAEIGDIERFATPASLARYAGIAPVTYSSGMNSVNYANQRGNRELNELFFRLSILQAIPFGGNKYDGGKRRVLNSFFHEYFKKKIAEGKTKRQALKCVQRRLVNIIWRMMKHKRPYTNPPAQHLEAKES